MLSLCVTAGLCCFDYFQYQSARKPSNVLTEFEVAVLIFAARRVSTTHHIDAQTDKHDLINVELMYTYFIDSPTLLSEYYKHYDNKGIPNILQWWL